jgi:hypothetical protein
LEMSGSSLELATKIVSAASTLESNWSMRPISISQSGNSAASSSARGSERLRIFIFLQFLDERCFTSNRDILPAPIIKMFASLGRAAGGREVSGDAPSAPTVLRTVQL